MRSNLLEWQWSLYERGHQARANLVLHAVSAPLFIVGTTLLLASPLRPVLALYGLVAMAATLVLQGRGHKRETNSPIPFLGALDFASRFVVEQWLTFPRFVLSGGFARAWKGAAQELIHPVR
ncbi:MAG: terminase [Myxococcaceae bacterium]